MKSLKCSLLSALFLMSVSAHAETGTGILKATGVKGGMIVHLGCGYGELTASLRVNDRYFVQGLDNDMSDVESARNALLASKIYGDVAIMHLSGNKLPYTDDLVNLLVAEEPSGISRQEMMRVIAPLGVLYVKENGEWQKAVKPWPEDIGEWTHFLNNPRNNAVARDERVGSPRSLRWVSGPRWSRSHEELASVSAMVTAKGRVFYIVDDAPLLSLRFPSTWKVIARDAFNGRKLWEQPIPNWVDKMRHFRSGPVHLPRRLVTVGENVFVTLGLDAPLSVLDAATGEILKTLQGTERTEEIVCFNDTLYLMVGTSESRRSGEGLARHGEPEPSATRVLKAIDINTDKELWSRDARGENYIIPLSLTACEGQVFFQSIKGITCLDAKTGNERWHTPRPTVARRYGWSSSTFVVADDVLLCTDRDARDAQGAEGDPQWVVSCFPLKSMPRGAAGVLKAYSTKDGRELWSSLGGKDGYNSPTDLFVIDSNVWTGPDFTRAYDLKTGAPTVTLPGRRAAVGMSHPRCYRNKASSNYIF